MRTFTKLFLVSLVILAISCVAAFAKPPTPTPAKTPFQKQVNLISDPQGSQGWTDFTIPDGQRLVIEFFSAQVGAVGVDVVDISISGTFNGDGTMHHFVATKQGTYDIATMFNTSQLTKIYIDSPNVHIHYLNSNSAPSDKQPVNPNAGVATVTGYLEPIP